MCELGIDKIRFRRRKAGLGHSKSELGNITWKHYQFGNTIINLKTSIFTWKYDFQLGNTTIDLETALFISKYHFELRNIIGFQVKKIIFSKLIVMFPT